MGIDGDAQKDLALSPVDAENVVGGLKKKAKAHKVAKAAHAGPNINIQTPMNPKRGSEDGSDDVAAPSPDVYDPAGDGTEQGGF